MKLWGGRFTKETNQLVHNFNASISYDQKFYKQDILGSIAHVTMLEKQGILTTSEKDAIVDGLQGILNDLESGALEITAEHEDIHFAHIAAGHDIYAEAQDIFDNDVACMDRGFDFDAAQGCCTVEDFAFRQRRLGYDRQERQFAAFDADRRGQHALRVGQFLMGIFFTARARIACDLGNLTVFQGNSKQAAQRAVDAVQLFRFYTHVMLPPLRKRSNPHDGPWLFQPVR